MSNDEMSGLLAFCTSRRDWLVETTTALVSLESPTPDKAAVDRCGREVAGRMEALDAAVDAVPSGTTGDHLRATFGSGAGQILLLGHIDTVWPVGQIERMPIRRDGDRLYGPGVFDMKAGIAIGMLAAAAVTRPEVHLGRRVVLLLTADEERGSGASRALVEAEARRSDAVCVLEPALPGGALKTRRKGSGEFELLVRGVASHAGLEPEKGASAISELAAQIGALDALADPARGVTVNVGLVAGGSRPNVVAEHARAVVDVRVQSAEDARRVEVAMRQLQSRDRRTALVLGGGFSRPPLERTAGVARLYGMAREVARALGRDLAEGAAGGGSDGNFTAALGVPTLDGLGAVGDGAHALHEHVDVGQMPWRAALVAGLLRRIAAGGQTDCQQPVAKPGVARRPVRRPADKA